MIQRKGTRDHQPCNSRRSRCRKVRHQKKTLKQLQIYKKQDPGKCENLKTSDETAGEYLARARTLVKSKIKNIAIWHIEFNEADAYHVCNGLLTTRLKSRILRWVSQFKTYKEFFNHIKDEWEWIYFMEKDFTGKSRGWRSLRLEQDRPRGPYRSRTVVGSKQSIPQVWEIPKSVGILGTVTQVSRDIGHWDPDHRGSELHSGEAEEAWDHTPQGTKLQGTKTLQ